mmetsp:Transcript_26161/g.51604  ORF Transcript_26161/g.51604 Transcript_26161/m.51604 type:complete len:130 (+) Transcript_26161:149-538(+)
MNWALLAKKSKKKHPRQKHYLGDIVRKLAPNPFRGVNHMPKFTKSQIQLFNYGYPSDGSDEGSEWDNGVDEKPRRRTSRLGKQSKIANNRNQFSRPKFSVRQRQRKASPPPEGQGFQADLRPATIWRTC